MFSPFHSTDYRTPSSITGRAVKTKCMCTLGPASSSKYTLGKLLAAGMNVARFNASHGTTQQWQETYDNLKDASSETGVTCATMLDIQGPEIRLGKFANGGAQIEQGQQFTFRTNYIEGDAKQVSVLSWTLWKHLNPGDKLIVDYGLISFTVVNVKPNAIECVADNSNYVGDSKHVIVQQKTGKGDKMFRCELLSYRDTEDIAFAAKNQFDFICAPVCDIEAFCKPDGTGTPAAAKKIQESVQQLRSLPGVTENKTQILLKISTGADVEMLDAILDHADGIVLCRSLLAVHVPIEQIAPLQKKIARRCNERMKSMVVMNHILTSMQKQPHPSRSEATDVANLVLDGVDCLVLTSPTARGQFPVETVEVMKRICLETENSMDYRGIYIARRNAIIKQATSDEAKQSNPNKRKIAAPALVSAQSDRFHGKAKSQEARAYQALSSSAKTERNDSLASSGVKLAWDLEAAAVIVFTDSGRTAHRVALYRPHCQLISITINERVARQMNIVWGVIPLVVSSVRDTDAVVEHVIRKCRGKKLLKSNDYIVKLSGVLAEQGAASDHLSAHIVQ